MTDKYLIDIILDDCVDTSSKCGRFAKDKFCMKNRKVRAGCQKSCNLCCKFENLEMRLQLVLK